MSRVDCPAFGKPCDKCGIENHFASVCEQRRSRASFAQTEGDTDDYGETSQDEYQTDEEDEYHTVDDEEEPAFHFAANALNFRKATTRNQTT